MESVAIGIADFVRFINQLFDSVNDFIFQLVQVLRCAIRYSEHVEFWNRVIAVFKSVKFIGFKERVQPHL